MWTYNKTAETFINYFSERNHAFIPSSSLIPGAENEDHSLLFTNSGMIQFKDIFLGTKKSESQLACNSQRCIRAGGKHNDLDDVGKDSYHHTFFEMLGSWSFNYTCGTDTISYFKEKTIFYAWDLLTNVYKLDKDNIYVTYFSGDIENNLAEDHETKKMWMQYLSSEKILPFGMKENFWEMGEYGPCGPSSEIHYDKIGGRDAKDLVNKDDPGVIEIWNLVFMQYYRNEDRTLNLLDSQHVDTGMGLERLVAILQNTTNYQIDLFVPIIKIIQEETNAVDYIDVYGDNDSDYLNMSYRVIADHVRTLIFAINDGVVPGYNKREHILRRVIRRAMRFTFKLNPKPNILELIISKTIDFLAMSCPELSNSKERILKIVSCEEQKFSKVMAKGLRMFDMIIKKKDVDVTSKLFQLYISIGFPIDIIRQLCLEHNIEFDEKKYEELMVQQVKISKRGKQLK